MTAEPHPARSVSNAGPAWRWLLRIVLVGAGAALSLNAGWLALTANLTIGTLLAAVVGVGLLAWGIWQPRVPAAIQVVAATLVLAVIGLSSFLAIYGLRSTATGSEDAVIVLGAAVHGDVPSLTLTGRLDLAVAYHAVNPRALIVVTGGQGFQENVAEGVAMGQYLRDRGVPADRIIVEDQATSTEQNFAFSRALLDQRLAPGYTVVVISDEFHLYRACRLAAAAGLKAHRIGRSTPWYFWAVNDLREDLLVVKLWLTGR